MFPTPEIKTIFQSMEMLLRLMIFAHGIHLSKYHTLFHKYVQLIGSK
jgi:hypothetical protein